MSKKKQPLFILTDVKGSMKFLSKLQFHLMLVLLILLCFVFSKFKSWQNIHIFCQLWRPENQPCFASNVGWFYAKNTRNWEGKSVYLNKNYLTENRLSRSKIYCAEDSQGYMRNIRAKKIRFEHQKQVARVLLLQWVTYFSGFWMLFRNLCMNLSPQGIYAHTK